MCPYGETPKDYPMTKQQRAEIYAWLGQWRDKFPPEAVAELQELLGPLNQPDDSTRRRDGDLTAAEAARFLGGRPVEPSVNASIVEDQLAEDLRLFGSAFYRLVDGYKVRIHPKDVWISPTGEIVTGALSTAEQVFSVNREVPQ